MSENNDIEEQHFSNLSKFIHEYEKQVKNGDQNSLNKFLDSYSENIIGRGRSRCGLSFDEDYVVKVAAGDKEGAPDGEFSDNFLYAIQINRTEIQNLNKDELGIYPRLYKSAKNWTWQIQEQVRPIDKVSEFIGFFPRFLKLLKALGKHFDLPYMSEVNYAFRTMEDLLLNIDDKNTNDFLKDFKILNLIDDKDAAKILRNRGVQEIDQKRLDRTKELVNRKFIDVYFRNLDKNFLKLYKSSKTSRTKNSLWDVRLGNVGVASDGRFVLLDPGFELRDEDRPTRHVSHSQVTAVKEISAAGAGAVQGGTEQSQTGWYSSYTTKKKKHKKNPAHMKGKNKTMMQERIKNPILQNKRKDKIMKKNKKTIAALIKEELENQFKRSLFQDVTENFGIPKTQAVAEFCRAVQHLMEDKGVEVDHLGEGDLSGAAIDCLADFPNYFQKHYGYEVEVDDMENVGRYTLKDGTKIIVYLQDGEMGFED